MWQKYQAERCAPKACKRSEAETRQKLSRICQPICRRTKANPEDNRRRYCAWEGRKAHAVAKAAMRCYQGTARHRDLAVLINRGMTNDKDTVWSPVHGDTQRRRAQRRPPGRNHAESEGAGKGVATTANGLLENPYKQL